MKRRVFYVATGAKFVTEACTSALSIRSKTADIHITAYFDIAPKDHPFDEIIIIKNPTHSFADKSPPFCDPPYEENIFIDTDTICLEDFSELKWTVLPREYNLRPVHGWLAAAGATVKILHGRGYPMRKAARHVNRVTRKHRGNYLKTRVGELNTLDRIYWKRLCKLGLDIK